jgi:DNA-binding ferritin-like protein
MPILNRLKTYIWEEDKEKMSKKDLDWHLSNLVSSLVMRSAQLHFCHFCISSGFLHEVLGELYECFNDWADDVMETGRYPNNSVGPTISVEISQYPTDPLKTTTDIVLQTVEDIKKAKDLAEKEKEEGIVSIFDNILSEIEKFRYKLRNLK